jgi:hypothetical protein
MPMQVEADLAWAREEFHTLSMRLQEIAPNHTIFEETAFSDEAMEEMSLSSQRLVKLHELYKETRHNSLRLRTCINEIEQLVSLVKSPVSPRQTVEAPPPLYPQSHRARRISAVGWCRDCNQF